MASSNHSGVTLYGAHELLALAQAPAADGPSPLGAQTSLAFDIEALRRTLPPGDTQSLADWLAALPCPVIGVGMGVGVANAAEDDPLSQACDALAADADEAGVLGARIAAHPIAATVLVQLLRAIEGLPIENALTMESLAYATLQAGPEHRAWLASARRQTAPPPERGPAVLIARAANALSLQLNRPANRNAMSVEMRDALVEALQFVFADTSIEKVKLSGRGACFSTGGDLREFGSAPDPATAHVVRSLSLPARLLARCATRVEVNLHGACIGSGIELPSFAARLTAKSNAFFQLPELRYGLIPGAGGCVGIARRIGRQKLAAWVIGGHRIRAATALSWGLIDATIE